MTAAPVQQSRSSTKKATWAVPGFAVPRVHGLPSSRCGTPEASRKVSEPGILEDGGVKVDVGIPDQLADVGRLRVPAEHLFEAEDVPVKSDGAIERAPPVNRCGGPWLSWPFCAPGHVLKGRPERRRGRKRPGSTGGARRTLCASKELAQNGARRETVPDRLVVRAAPFALLRNSRKTECGAKQFLTRLVVRAAPFALLRNSRKTERGAKQFLTVWWCAPHPLRF